MPIHILAQIPKYFNIREPHSIHLTKIKAPLKECKVEQLQEQNKTAELVSKFSFSFLIPYENKFERNL